MRVAFVVVRYGTDIRGGAEQGCRMLAERLAQQDGWSVEVFTTCATDSVTWADDLPAGSSELNRVTVHRFRSTQGRHRRFESFSADVLAGPEQASPGEEQRWIDWQGPVCPSLAEAAAASQADVVVLTPYLYWPTVRTVERMAGGNRPLVMHPAGHDEPPIRLPLFRRVFAGQSGLVYYTDGERHLVEQLFPDVSAVPQLVLGLGVEPQAGDAVAFRAAYGLGERPYLLCLGRVDDGKGAALLARYFIAYKRRRPGPLQLVFAGPVVNRPPDHPDIVVTGPLDDPNKWGALSGASALVSPSPNESFSLVVLEAWSAGIPVLVHGRCAATTEHARRSRGGLAFTGYATFEATVDRLLDDGDLRRQLANAGAAYVEENFRWPTLIGRYTRFLQRVGGVVTAGAAGGNSAATLT